MNTQELIMLKQKAKGRFWSAFTPAKRTFFFNLGSVLIITTQITK